MVDWSEPFKSRLKKARVKIIFISQGTILIPQPICKKHYPSATVGRCQPLGLNSEEITIRIRIKSMKTAL